MVIYLVLKQLCRRTLLPSLPRSLLTWQIEQLDLGVVVNDITRDTRQRRKFVRGRLGLCWREGGREEEGVSEKRFVFLPALYIYK